VWLGIASSNAGLAARPPWYSTSASPTRRLKASGVQVSAGHPASIPETIAGRETA
jgi:hypothetical protein